MQARILTFLIWCRGMELKTGKFQIHKSEVIERRSSAKNEYSFLLKIDSGEDSAVNFYRCLQLLNKSECELLCYALRTIMAVTSRTDGRSLASFYSSHLSLKLVKHFSYSTFLILSCYLMSLLFLLLQQFYGIPRYEIIWMK